MSNYDDDSPDRAKPYATQLEMTFHELADVLDQAEMERLKTGGYSYKTVVKLEARVLALRRRLLPFVAKSAAVSDIWERFGIDAIPQETAVVVGETEAKVTEYGNTVGGGEKKIQRADPERLMAWGDALIQAYAELGFAPELDESDYRTSPEDAV